MASHCKMWIGKFDSLWFFELLDAIKFISFYLLFLSRHCFGPDSAFLRYLLFFFNAKDKNDVDVLIEACRLLLQYVRLGGKPIPWFLLDLVIVNACSYNSSQACLGEGIMTIILITLIWAILPTVY